MRLVVASVLAVSLAACGPSPMPLDDYADAMEQLGRTHETLTTELQRALHDDLQIEIDDMMSEVDQSDPEALRVMADEVLALTLTRTVSFFAALGDAMGVYRTKLVEMVPPRSLEAEHLELLAAADGILRGLPALLEALDDVEEFDAIDAAVNGSAFIDAQPRFAAACNRLEQSIIEQGVAVNLRCPA